MLSLVAKVWSHDEPSVCDSLAAGLALEPALEMMDNADVSDAI